MAVVGVVRMSVRAHLLQTPLEVADVLLLYPKLVGPHLQLLLAHADLLVEERDRVLQRADVVSLLLGLQLLLSR